MEAVDSHDLADCVIAFAMCIYRNDTRRFDLHRFTYLLSPAERIRQLPEIAPILDKWNVHFYYSLYPTFESF